MQRRGTYPKQLTTRFSDASIHRVIIVFTLTKICSEHILKISDSTNDGCMMYIKLYC